jgi:hypothetical protein
MPGIPDGWTLTASSFNWTPDVIRAERSGGEIVTGIAAGGIADVVELEAGQVWRSFPVPDDDEVQQLRAGLAEVGGRVSIVGASIDDFTSQTERRSEQQRLAFLLPQLRAAHRVGAFGVRLPFGQAGLPLLERLQPILEDLDLILFEEAQGQQSPGNPSVALAYQTIAELDDPRIRVLVDTSMLMPTLPVTYLDRLRTAGLPGDFVDRLEQEWRDEATLEAVRHLLASGGVPPDAHTLFMNLLVRFGRSDASDLSDILPLVGGFHLKLWDLEDADGRVSTPIHDLAALLARTEFRGTLTSEWGGHEWLDDDPADVTRRHLALARTALSKGAVDDEPTDALTGRGSALRPRA